MYQRMDRDIRAAIATAANPEQGIMRSLACFQAPRNQIGPSGQVNLASDQYDDIVGLVDIPCTSAPVSEARLQATEVKELESIMSSQLRHVLLGGYYPTIANHTDWRLTIRPKDQDRSHEVAWDVLGAECDSAYSMTRVEIKLAKL